jgi:hypothetical protein
MNLLVEDHISEKHALPELLNNTQGYILVGHGCDYLSYGFVTFNGADQAAIRGAFARLAPLITKAQELADEKELARDARDRNRVVWAAGISSSGYECLGLAGWFPPSFEAGFARRSDVLGLGGTAKWTNTWKEQQRYDALIVLAARTGKKPESGAYEGKSVPPDTLISAKACAEKIFQGMPIKWQDGFVKRENCRQVEHFGFADGISQPVFFDTEKSRAPRRQSGWDPKAPLGLVLVRDPYPSSEYAAEYGSFCAFLNIEQHEAEFEGAAKALAGRVGCPVDHAREMIIGRRTTGEPLVPRGSDVNDFDDDPESGQLEWPTASHTRRMNFREHPHRRILRRGVVYDSYGEKGLLFQSFQANLREQFEKNIERWANNPTYPPGNVGIDPMIGTSSTAPQKWPLQEKALRAKVTKSGESIMTECPVHGVTTIRGGDYFYFPSIPWLGSLEARS